MGLWGTGNSVSVPTREFLGMVYDLECGNGDE